MKKWESRLQTIMIFTSILLAIIALILYLNRNRMSEQVYEVLKDVILIGSVFVMILTLFYIGLHIISRLKMSVHNIKQCDDKLFEIIDRGRNCWEENNDYYVRQIEIINCLYKENGKVDQLVHNKEIGRLFARADFLKVGSAFSKDVMTYFTSIITSVAASYVCNIMQSNNSWNMIIYFFVFLVFAFSFIGFKYGRRGINGSYRYLIDEYESRLLMEKIEKLEKSLKISVNDEDALKTKNVVINELNDIRKKCKNDYEKEQLVADINCVERLNLYIGEYANCYKQKIYVNKKLCFLVYDKKKGKKNNYIGEFNLKTKDYTILYHILEKNNLIEVR